MREAFGGLSTDWKEGINWAAVREWRLKRAHEAMGRHGGYQLTREQMNALAQIANLPK